MPSYRQRAVRFAEGRFSEKESEIEPPGGDAPVTPLPQSWPAQLHKVLNGPRLFWFVPCFRRQRSAEKSGNSGHPGVDELVDERWFGR